MDILKIFRCEYCNNKIVIMYTSNNHLIPVNVNSSEKIPAKEIFDSKKYESHLKTCPVLSDLKKQELWHKKKFFLEQNPERLKISIPDPVSEPVPDLQILPKKKIRELSAEEKAEHEKRFAEILEAEKRQKEIEG